MKSIFYFVLIVFIAIAINSSNEGNNAAAQKETVNKEETIQTSSMKSTTLTNGLKNVLDSIADLKRSVNNHAEMKEATMELDENWDEIEDKIEDKYPKDYKNIEKSLYPLLAEARRESPNLLTVKQLLKESTKKITEFKDKVSKPASF